MNRDAEVAGHTGLLLENGLFRLDFARRVTLAMLEDVPFDRWCLQPVAGGNHAMWIAGHLAATDDFFLVNVGRRTSALPEGWTGLFATGSKPVADLDAYPAPEVVMAQLAARREDLQSWFRSLTEAELRTPLPAGMRFAANLAELMPSVAWHEAWHGGQLSLVRKALGLAPKFG
jgi:uncharacterized damage-inducible protein DinB